MDFGKRSDPPCGDCDTDGHCTMNCGPSARRQAVTEASLRAALVRMTQAFRPFTLKPIGGAGSQARADQDEQIAAHAEAMKLLGK